MIENNNFAYASPHGEIPSNFLSGEGTVDLTVSIVNYNVRDDLHRCLASIRNLKTHLTLQVIVVDNNSTDSSVEMVRRDFPEITLLASQTNLGYAGGNNRAFAEAQGKHILILNPDTEIQPGAFEAIVEYLQLHPDVGGVGCRLLNSDGSLQHSILAFPTLRNIFAGLFKLDYTLFRSIPAFQSYRHDLDYEKAQTVATLLGACLMIPRVTLRAIGPMDERFFLYAEEADLCYRIGKMGKEIHYIPDGTIIHHRERSTGSHEYIWRFTRRLQSSYLFFEKHYTRHRTLLLKWMLWVRFSLQRLGYCLRLIGGGDEERRQKVRQLDDMIQWLRARNK